MIQKDRKWYKMEKQQITQQYFDYTTQQITAGTLHIEPQVTCCDLVLVRDGKTYIFTPQEDITPLESVRLTQWMITHKMSFYTVNFDFIEKYNLWRHFSER